MARVCPFSSYRPTLKIMIGCQVLSLTTYHDLEILLKDEKEDKAHGTKAKYF
jgi:hypothetical protein